MKNLINPICRIVSLLLLFAAILFTIAWFSSCSVQRIEQKSENQIEWDSSKEDFLHPNINDAMIVGISRNGKKYKIVNGHGHNAGKMRSETKPDSSMIWCMFICEF